MSRPGRLVAAARSSAVAYSHYKRVLTVAYDHYKQVSAVAYGHYKQVLSSFIISSYSAVSKLPLCSASFYATDNLVALIERNIDGRLL